MHTPRAFIKINGEKTDLPISTSASWAWKESPDEVVKDTIVAINQLLKDRNLHIAIHSISDPMLEGSDTYGYMFSTRKMTKKQAKKISKKEWGM